MKKICLLISVLMLCTVLFGCADDTEKPDASKKSAETLSIVGSIPVTFPLVTEPASLKIMTTSAGDKNQDSVFVWQQYEKMTGVDIVWTGETKSSRTEAVHTALTEGQQYDLIMRCKISATKLLRYGQNGMIIDLAKDGLLKKYAPNCWAYL